MLYKERYRMKRLLNSYFSDINYYLASLTAIFLLLLIFCNKKLNAQNSYDDYNNNIVSQINNAIIDSKFDGWRLFEKNINDEEKICYLILNPVSSNSDYNKRDEPFLMITRSTKTRKEEIFFSGGFYLKNKSTVFVMIDGENHYFIANEDIAWTKDKKDNFDVIKKLLNSKNVITRYDGAIGKFAIDKYNLNQIKQAYQRMREICG